MHMRLDGVLWPMQHPVEGWNGVCLVYLWMSFISLFFFFIFFHFGIDERHQILQIQPQTVFSSGSSRIQRHPSRVGVCL